MSIETRISLIQHPNLVLRNSGQRDDIANLNGIQSQLVEYMLYMLNAGVIMEITSLRSDHGPDGWRSAGAPYWGTHQYGWSVDWWPNSVNKRGMYLPADDARFRRALRVASRGPRLRQIGLGGEAYTPLNVLAAGPTAFSDGPLDHLHVGVNGR